MADPVILRRRVAGQIQQAIRDIAFRRFGSPGDFLQRMAIAVARIEIHLRVDPGGIPP